MKFIFIDESEFNRKKAARSFLLGGLVVPEEKLTNLEKEIESLKLKYNFKNLKEFRNTVEIRRSQKMNLTKEIAEILRNHEVSFIASIKVVTKRPTWEVYSDSLYVILERFFLKINRSNETGILICDSLPKPMQEKVSKRLHREMWKYSISFKGDHRGKIVDHIYPTLFFQDDEFSNILQVSDLICTSLQQAVKEFQKSNPRASLEGNENHLKHTGPYLELYWDFLEKGYRGVTGWGIKVW